jgi:long-chain acyl-CoA synthetase
MTGRAPSGSQPPQGVFDVLDAPLRRHADAPALVTRQGRLSYAELDDLADRAAGALRLLGVRPGDRVAASLPNDLDIVVAFHGAMRLGAVWLGINRALTASEQAYMLADAGATLALMDDSGGPAGADGGAGPTRRVDLPGWREALTSSRGRPAVARPDPYAPAGIAYTSGTTGFPKGAVHCQAAMVLPGAASVARRGWGPSLRKGDSLPLNILNMMILTTVLTAQAGATAVIMDHSDIASVVNWIREERVSVWNGPPAQLYTMVRDETIAPKDLDSLDEVWVGGADCPDSLRDDFEARFGVTVSRTYGLTEAPALVCLDDLSARPAGTSGRPLDHVRVTTEDGEILLSAQEDGPWAGAYRPMLGYWGREDASAEALSGGCLHTGDLGELDEAGHLRVVGRKSLVIIRGGANVYPAEVERILSDAPGVNACAVVGVPDERLGERVGAAIERRAGEAIDEAAVLAHCRSFLAAFKVPERLVVVDSLPRNQMGKVPREDVVRLLRQADRP